MFKIRLKKQDTPPDIFLKTSAKEILTALQGAPGKSAYEMWLLAGNEGSIEDYLESLKGPQGPKGDTGATGNAGKDGTSVTVASVSESSADGGSNIVTFSDGKTLTIKNGSKGSNGTNGSNGKDGVSATHSWSGTTLTVTSASGTSSANLKGDKGDKGEKGDTGEAGPQGPKGDTGSAGTNISFSLPSSGWSSSAPYTQAVTVDGILSTDNPVADVVLSSTDSTAISELEAWGCVSEIITANGSITARCLEEKPAVNLNVQFMVVR